MNYGFIITAAGWRHLTSLLAGERLELTRVMVGSGRVPDDKNPADLTALVAPVALATSTAPNVSGTTVSFVVEYRNDLNGGLETGFWLNEYGVFALDAEQNEILLYYATLGDYPQYVTPVSMGGVDIHRYPVSIVLTDELQVEIGYPPLAFMTSEDIKDFYLTTVFPECMSAAQGLIDAHNNLSTAHPDIRYIIETSLISRINRLEDMLLNDISTNPYMIEFTNLTGLLVSGVWNQASQRIEF